MPRRHDIGSGTVASASSNAADATGKISAIDPDSGQTIQTVPQPWQPNRPLALGDRVIVADRDHAEEAAYRWAH